MLPELYQSRCKLSVIIVNRGTQVLKRSTPNQWTQSYQILMSTRTQAQLPNKLLSDQCQTNMVTILSDLNINLDTSLTHMFQRGPNYFYISVIKVESILPNVYLEVKLVYLQVVSSLCLAQLDLQTMYNVIYLQSQPENCGNGRWHYSISEVHLILFKAYSFTWKLLNHLFSKMGLFTLHKCFSLCSMCYKKS